MPPRQRTGSTTEPRTSPRDRRAPDGAGARRGARPARIRDRNDVDLLILAVADDGLADGRQFIERIRERSDGAVVLTERRIYHELHRMRRERLIADTGRGQHHYVLTDLGRRILASRTAQWRAYARAMDRVLGPDGGER